MNKMGDKKMNLKNILIFCIAFIFMSFFVNASLDIDLNLHPTTAYTNDDLRCSFNVEGNLSTYNVNVQWIKDEANHSTPIAIAAQNNTLTNVTLASTQTSKTENWRCNVSTTNNVVNESALSNTVTILNSAPTISSISTQNAETDKSFSYQVNANDLDGDTLIYSLVTNPEGMTINNNTGRISWTPEEDQVGNHDVTVRVNDGAIATETSFEISVSRMKLEVDRIRASCSPSCRDYTDREDGGSIERVRPGSSLDLEITLENLWDRRSDEDYRIEDIEIFSELEEMGSSWNYQDDEESIRRLDAGRTETVKFTFDIPEDTDDDRYDLFVEIEGIDEKDGEVYRITHRIDVEVEKETDSMIFKTASLSPSTVSCDRTTQLRVNVKNIGSNTQRGAQLSVLNSELDIEKIEFFDVYYGYYDDSDTEFEKTYTLNIPKNTNPGTYDIELRAYYERSSRYESKTLPLVVKECVTYEEPTEPTEPKDSDDDEKEEEVIVVTQPQIQIPTTQTPTTTTDESKTTFQRSAEDFYDSIAFTVILVLVFILLLLGVIYLGKLAFAKK